VSKPATPCLLYRQYTVFLKYSSAPPHKLSRKKFLLNGKVDLRTHYVFGIWHFECQLSFIGDGLTLALIARATVALIGKT